MKNFHPTSEEITAMAATYGITDHDAEDLILLRRIINHLNRGGDVRTTVIYLTNMMERAINRRFIRANEPLPKELET